jgi:hypothetical protein
MTLRTHPLARVVDVLVFILAVAIMLSFLSCFAPVYSQVINPPPALVSGGPDTNAVPRVRTGSITNIVVISGAEGGDFYNGAYTWNGSVYAKSFDTWIVRVEDHWEIQNGGTPEWGSQIFPFEWYPLANPGYPTGAWGLGPVTNYDEAGNFHGNFVGTLNGQWPSAGTLGDMLASVWANGSADGNPNAVDRALYAGNAGAASSATVAGNATQWNGFDMPGDPGFNSYIAFLAHNEYGQLTWIQADSWRGPQGEQGPAGEMTASTWANGSSSSNPNVIDHASYADSAGNTSYWNGFALPSSDGLLFFSTVDGFSVATDVMRQSGEQVVGSDFVLQGTDRANVVVRGGYGGAHEQPGASITFGGSDVNNTPGVLTFDAGGITVSGQTGLDATRTWLGADGMINTVTITHGLITAWEQVPNP